MKTFLMPFMAFALTILAEEANSQAPDTLWTMMTGGIYDDRGLSVQQTADGGYVVAGWSNSFGSGNDDDIYLIRADASGDTLWTRIYGGGGNDSALEVQQTADGGYIVAGYSYTMGSWRVYLLKTDASGNMVWYRPLGGAGSDMGFSVQQTADSGYIVAGYTTSFGAGHRDVYLIKTNVSGDTLWTRTYGGPNEDQGLSVRQTADGGYVVAGLTYSFGAGDCDTYLIRTDASGDTLWTRTYGGADEDRGRSVVQTDDGGFIVAGFTYSSDQGNMDVYLIKTDGSGDAIWERTYGGPGDDRSFSVQQTADGGYIITGWTFSFGAGNGDVYVIRTDAAGDTLWTSTYGGSGYDSGFSVQQTVDGGYVVAGWTFSYGWGYFGDVWLIRLGPDLQEIPTISEWGMMVLSLILLAAATAAFTRRRRPASIRW